MALRECKSFLCQTRAGVWCTVLALRAASIIAVTNIFHSKTCPALVLSSRTRKWRPCSKILLNVRERESSFFTFWNKVFLFQKTKCKCNGFRERIRDRECTPAWRMVTYTGWRTMLTWASWFWNNLVWCSCGGAALCSAWWQFSYRLLSQVYELLLGIMD